MPYIESGPSSFILESGPPSLQVSQTRPKSAKELGDKTWNVSVFWEWDSVAGKPAWNEVCLLCFGGSPPCHCWRGIWVSLRKLRPLHTRGAGCSKDALLVNSELLIFETSDWVCCLQASRHSGQFVCTSFFGLLHSFCTFFCNQVFTQGP